MSGGLEGFLRGVARRAQNLGESIVPATLPKKTSDEIYMQKKAVEGLTDAQTYNLIALIASLALTVLGIGLCAGGIIAAGIPILILSVPIVWGSYNMYQVADNAKLSVREFLDRKIDSERMSIADFKRYVKGTIHDDYKTILKTNTFLFCCVINLIYEKLILPEASPLLEELAEE